MHGRIVKCLPAALAAGFFCAGPVESQALPQLSGYRNWRAPAVRTENSARIRDLLRAGNLYLSRQDAVALAIENNLDVEVQRLGTLLADTDVLRSRGGGVVRGLTYTVGEAPAGVGGPASPLVTAAANRFTSSWTVPTNPSELGVLGGTQSNLQILSTTPLSSGPAVPQLDPAITGLWNWTHQTAPQSSPLLTGASSLVTNSLLANAGAQKGFGSGGQVALAFNNDRQSLNSPRASYSPFTVSSLGLTLTQPLLRGFGRAMNRRFIRIAWNEQKISRALFRQQLVATVYGVTRLYIDLVALNEDLKVKQQTLAVVQRLYEDTKAQVEEGTLADIELTRATAQISAAREDLINAGGRLEEQEAILKNVITRQGLYDAAVAAARVVPTDPLTVPEQEETLPVQDLVQEALANRGDLAQAALQVENSRISLEGAHNALRPQLDLVGTTQNSGLAGQLNPLAATPDAQFLGGYGSLLRQLAARNYPTYGVGLQLTLPLRNRVAQADAARDEVQLRQSEIRLAQLRNQARLEVEDALIAMRRARAACQAAAETRLLQEQSFAAEQARFEQGLSTGFFLMQYESLLAQARSTEVVAKASYVKARAALLRATGANLDALGISLDEALKGPP
jgi:outer membrane protein